LAKKSKRPVRKVLNPVVEKSVADPLVGNRQSSFNPDYHFVIKDIRRVGVLAGSFIIILVVLSFFLH
jgi:hypothetical protein